MGGGSSRVEVREESPVLTRLPSRTPQPALSPRLSPVAPIEPSSSAPPSSVRSSAGARMSRGRSFRDAVGSVRQSLRRVGEPPPAELVVRPTEREEEAASSGGWLGAALRGLSTAGARCAEAAAAPATGCCAMVLAEPADAVAVVAIGRRGTQPLRRRELRGLTVTLSAVGAATPLLPAAAAAAQRAVVDERANTTAWLVPAANASAAAVLVCAAGAPALLQELEVEVFAIS